MKRKRDTLLSIPAPEARLLSVKAAAAYLSATVWFVRRLAWEKQVPFLHFGNRLLFDRADLDRFVESRKTAVSL